jgi:hypothetical protein
MTRARNHGHPEVTVPSARQAIALAACYRREWPLLVVVPASLRLMWVEELERWLPFLRPQEIAVIFNSADRDALRRVPPTRPLCRRAHEGPRRVCEPRTLFRHPSPRRRLSPVSGVKSPLGLTLRAGLPQLWAEQAEQPGATQAGGAPGHVRSTNPFALTLPTLPRNASPALSNSICEVDHARVCWELRARGAGLRRGQAEAPLPQVVVISYHMAANLKADMVRVKWGVVLMDESHNITTCSSGRGHKENAQTTAAREVAAATARVVLMSGTPSLSRPFDLFNQVQSLAGLRVCAVLRGLACRRQCMRQFAVYCDVLTARGFDKGRVTLTAGGRRAARFAGARQGRICQRVRMDVSVSRRLYAATLPQESVRVQTGPSYVASPCCTGTASARGSSTLTAAAAAESRGIACTVAAVRG